MAEANDSARSPRLANTSTTFGRCIAIAAAVRAGRAAAGTSSSRTAVPGVTDDKGPETCGAASNT